MTVVAGIAWAADDRAVLLWSGFETDAEAARWRTLDTQLERSTRFATAEAIMAIK